MTRSPERVARTLRRRGLTVHQRLAIHALVMTTTRPEALKLLDQNGVQVDKSTLSRWFKREDFRAALADAEAVVAGMISKESVLRKSEAILDKAMEGTPILGYVDKDEQEIVGYKPDLPTAARVVEMQGKAVGLFADETALKLAVLVDVDFSGRKDAPPVIDVKAEPIDVLKRQHVSEDDWLG